SQEGQSMAKSAALFFFATLGVSLAAQQASTPTFKSRANAVLVDVRVTDQNGRFVGDLASDDLTIFEDGHEQAISTFDLVNIPIETDAHPASVGDRSADVATNEGDVGRLYVIVLDDLHANAFRTDTVRAIAHQFIEQHFAARDRAVVVTT